MMRITKVCVSVGERARMEKANDITNDKTRATDGREFERKETKAATTETKSKRSKSLTMAAAAVMATVHRQIFKLERERGRARGRGDGGRVVMPQHT